MMSTLITSKEIPPDLLERYPNLRSYLSTLNKKSHADMAYLQTLSRDLRTLKQFNIVYPVGEPIFIHIMSRGRERPLYSVVSPMSNVPSNLLKIFETSIASLISAENDFSGREEHENILNEALDQVILIDDTLDDFDYNVISGRGWPYLCRLP